MATKYTDPANPGPKRYQIAAFFQEWGGRITLILIAVIWLILVAGVWAEASESDSGNDEYNFSWLDKDKKIYVLQNRKFLRGGHAILSVMGGSGFSNPYRTTYQLDPRIAFYFNETWGVELFYTSIFNSPNSVAAALAQAAPNTFPDIREIRAQYGGMVHYVPWYAKINVFNTILHFDWYFGVGVSAISAFVDTAQLGTQSNYQQQSLTGLVVSTGHEYHLSQSFLARIDLTGVFYSAPVLGLSGNSSIYSNYNFGVGLGWRP